jgi:hypothetical protein
MFLHKSRDCSVRAGRFKRYKQKELGFYMCFGREFTETTKIEGLVFKKE